MIKNLLIVVLIGLFIAGAYFFYTPLTKREETVTWQEIETKEVVQPKLETKQIVIGTKEYKINLTQTEEDRKKGLAIFDSLPANEGMLFSFDQEDYYVFWMKDMKFNIDIIFLDQDKKVLEVFESVKAEPGVQDMDLKTYSSKLKSQFIIELKEGETRKNGIKPGDTVLF